MWVAKCCINDAIVSKKFKNIRDCQKFIDNKCQKLEFLARELTKESESLQGISVLHFYYCVRCWNVEQKRWCDAFDF